jgi:hypothetical protein
VQGLYLTTLLDQSTIDAHYHYIRLVDSYDGRLDALFAFAYVKITPN